MKYVKVIGLVMLMSGCTSSYHNLNTDGSNSLGGGFADHKVHEGLYSIVAKTNFAPWADFSTAHKMFKRRATELCKSENFKSVRVKESQYEHIPTAGLVKYIISQVNGYVICNPEAITDEEAEKLIQASYKVSAGSQ
ncbi:hypothetical protein [Rheinheimera sp. MM224]|uniref:hypothetical protein n=1 Tax=Rheinheimera sp. MM224 TaxID=3019969 RepID=UPI0021F8AA81|nr:hypothetical protein [Rheinheimera sp. MM224]CAI3801289.1 hypothetical protein JAMGFMIE_02802 [Rheinheimera sp. MM224]